LFSILFRETSENLKASEQNDQGLQHTNLEQAKDKILKIIREGLLKKLLGNFLISSSNRKLKNDTLSSLINDNLNEENLIKVIQSLTGSNNVYRPPELPFAFVRTVHKEPRGFLTSSNITRNSQRKCCWNVCNHCLTEEKIVEESYSLAKATTEQFYRGSSDKIESFYNNDEYFKGLDNYQWYQPESVARLPDFFLFDFFFPLYIEIDGEKKL
jgi:hypothetical protein